MNTNKLLNALGQVDDKYIVEAQPGKNNTKYSKRFFAVSIPVAAAVMVLAGAILLQTQFSDLFGLVPIESSSKDPSESSISKDPTSSEGENPPLITAKLYDGYNPDDGLIYFDRTYISDMLQSELDSIKDKNAVFRTVVFILATSDEEHSNEELERKINEANEKLNIAIEEYEQLPLNDSDDTSESHEKYEKVMLLDDALFILEQEFYKESRIKNLNEKLEFVKKIGAKNVEPIDGSSDVGAEFWDGYFMELSAENINEMYKHGGFMIRFALPKRIDGYDIRISDSLTALLDGLGDEETIHVAVVSRIDRYNKFATKSDRRLAANPEYNKHLYRDFSTYTNYEKSNAGLDKYIEDILIRNNILNNRKNKSANDRYYFQDTPPDQFFAGFEAELTKSEIIKLASDDEVKVIYAMQYENADYYMDE